MTKKRLIGTIDMTPTWASLMPGIILALEAGTDKGKQLARDELMGLARTIDAMNEQGKRRTFSRRVKYGRIERAQAEAAFPSLTGGDQ